MAIQKPDLGFQGPPHLLIFSSDSKARSDPKSCRYAGVGSTESLYTLQQADDGDLAGVISSSKSDDRVVVNLNLEAFRLGLGLGLGYRYVQIDKTKVKKKMEKDKAFKELNAKAQERALGGHCLKKSGKNESCNGRDLQGF